MSDSKVLTVLNDGSELDAELLDAIRLKRLRTQIGGASLAAIAAVLNADPTGAEYALLVRLVTAALSNGNANLQQGFANYTTSGDKTLVSAVAAKKVRLYAALISAGTPVGLTLKSAGVAISSKKFVGANGGVWYSWQEQPHFISPNANEALQLNLDVDATVGIDFWFTQL